MRWLPPPARTASSIQLPLPDRSAEELMTVLLGNDRDERQAGLSRILRFDPSLCLWTALNCEIPVRPNIRQLATLLESKLPECFKLSNEPSPIEDESSHVEIATYAIQLADSTRETARSTSADPEFAYLLALFFGAMRWVASAADFQVPDTIASDIAAIRSQQAAGHAESACVIRAMECTTGAHAAIRNAWSWWTDKSQVAIMLPPLCQKITRLKGLERDFQAQLENQKLSAMYKLAAGAGHEINNPLGSIAGRAQLLLRDEQNPERRRTLGKINSQAFRAHEMIADMMLFAKAPKPIRERVDLVNLVDTLLTEFRDEAEERQTRITRRARSDAIEVEADATQLTVALRAMCLNSLEAIGMGGNIEIELSVIEQSGQDPLVAEIKVRDDGPGIAPEHRDHIFDPFYSGREAGRGLGFGLSKCWRIVTNHGGRILVSSEPPRGTQFTIVLPAA